MTPIESTFVTKPINYIQTSISITSAYAYQR